MQVVTMTDNEILESALQFYLEFLQGVMANTEAYEYMAPENVNPGDIPGSIADIFINTKRLHSEYSRKVKHDTEVEESKWQQRQS